MVSIEVFRQGFDHVTSGEFEPILRFLGELLEGYETVQSAALPEWVHVDSGTILSDSNSRFWSVLDLDRPDSPVVIDPESSFDQIDVSLVNARSIERVTVEATFTHESGSRHAESIELARGGNDVDQIPLSFRTPKPATGAELKIAEMQAADPTLGRRIVETAFGSRRMVEGPRMTTPAIRSTGSSHPIFLVSVDTFRYDNLDRFDDLLDALGDDAVVPKEPRTQGYWTPPSHASMLTGTHPGSHGFTGKRVAQADAANRKPIDPELMTLGELLQEHGYKSSGLVSHGNLVPPFGFGRGYSRYQYEEMSYDDWLEPGEDTGVLVDELVSWLDRDLRHTDAENLFYFCHTWAAHWPYIPPAPWTKDVDYELLQRTKSTARGWDDGREHVYVDRVRERPTISEEYLEQQKEYYGAALEHVSSQLVRLVDRLKYHGIYDEAFIVVTGDHGEEFYERGFESHASLYDANVRQGMIIKPPSSVDWDVPDVVDTIDLYPTIARLVGADVPEQCQGVPLQEGTDPERPRIVERVDRNDYSIAVESGDTKAIYTFYTDTPGRPDESALDEGPDFSEFYSLEAVRAGDFDDVANELDRSEKDELYRTARRFILENRGSTANETLSREMDRRMEQNLRDLGYID